MEHTARQEKKIPNTQQRETFKEENFHELAENMIFAGNLSWIIPLGHQWTLCSQISQRKLSRIATKSQNSRKFFAIRYIQVVY